jgi:hypothetical protein
MHIVLTENCTADGVIDGPPTGSTPPTKPTTS